QGRRDDEVEGTAPPREDEVLRLDRSVRVVKRGADVGVVESKLRGIQAQALVRASPSEFRRQRPGDAPGAASDVQNSIGAAQARHLLEDSQRVLADLAVVARADTEQEGGRRNRRFACAPRL